MRRLGKNISGYHGETIDIHTVLEAIEAAARDHGWSSEPFLHAGDVRWLALTRPASRIADPATRVYISAGIHGDEPAGPLAVRQLLRENAWPDNVELWLCPCLNPAGYASNRRENDKGIDLNRQYRSLEAVETRAHVAWLERQPPFNLCLCLHEDWESQGFYLYELNPENLPSLAEAMIARIAKVCPIDCSDTIEGRQAKGGIIRPDLDPQTRPEWPEAFHLIQKKTRLSYTLEAPSDFPLAIRVAGLVDGVRAALDKQAES
jgi:hypothetical protein